MLVLHTSQITWCSPTYASCLEVIKKQILRALLSVFWHKSVILLFLSAKCLLEINCNSTQHSWQNRLIFMKAIEWALKHEELQTESLCLIYNEFLALEADPYEIYIYELIYIRADCSFISLYMNSLFFGNWQQSVRIVTNMSKCNMVSKYCYLELIYFWVVSFILLSHKKKKDPM